MLFCFFNGTLFSYWAQRGSFKQPQINQPIPILYLVITYLVSITVIYQPFSSVPFIEVSHLFTSTQLMVLTRSFTLTQPISKYITFLFDSLEYDTLLLSHLEYPLCMALSQNCNTLFFEIVAGTTQPLVKIVKTLNVCCAYNIKSKRLFVLREREKIFSEETTYCNKFLVILTPYKFRIAMQRQ